MGAIISTVLRGGWARVSRRGADREPQWQGRDPLVSLGGTVDAPGTIRNRLRLLGDLSLAAREAATTDVPALEAEGDRAATAETEKPAGSGVG